MKTTEFEYLIDSNPEVARIELESQSLKLRVVEADGTPRVVTQEIDKHRVNVAIADGIITSIVSIG